MITAEGDVTRDEAEAFAGNPRAPGVAVSVVRCPDMTHDCAMLQALAETCAARAADMLARAPGDDPRG